MKRRFEFRLGRVLGIRKIEEKQARLTWAQADREAREAEAATEETRQGLTELRVELAATRSASEFAHALLLERVVDTRVTELARRIQRAHTLEQQAARLSEAWRAAESRRRGLSELEQRGRTIHRRALEDADQRELDDRASALGRNRPRDPEEGSSFNATAADERTGLPAPPPPR